MIPAKVIDEIRYRNDIETVISSYVTLKRAGSNVKGLCPFHSEKTPSFTVYPGTQSFFCFGCGAGGDVVNFVMRMENLDYRSALETLAKRAGIALPDFDDKTARSDGLTRTRTLQMNLEAAKFYRRMLFDENIGAPGRQYFADRGLSSATVKRFGLGYSPQSGNMMLRHLKSLGFSEKEILEANLARQGERGYYDNFRGRVMFPIIDMSGNVIAFGGRVLDDSKPKYLNSSDTPAFKKSRNMFAFNYAKNADAGYLILCEGYMDVIALHAAGFNMAVATLGTAITAEQARLMKKYTDKVIISYDSDEAGQKAAKRAIALLEEAGIDAKVLRMSGAKDPDEFIKKFGAQEFGKLIDESRDKYEYMLDGIRTKYSLTNPAEKIKALSDVCDFLAAIPSSVEREIYTDRTVKEFGVSQQSISHDVDVRRRKAAALNAKKQRENLISITAGIGDRVNPDFVKAPKGARIEETVLGMLMLMNGYIELAVDGNPLEESDFITSLGKRLFKFAKERYSSDGFSPSQLNEEFTTDEVSRVYKMIAERSELSGNDEESFRTYVRAMREEGAKTAQGELSLEDIIAKKRKQEETKQ